MKKSRRQCGFTLIELVTVIVILGIVAVVALPRMFDQNGFESRAYYDQVLSTLRYAQKLAVAQHRFVCVSYGASSLTLTYDPVSPSATHTVATCSSALTSPAGTTPYVVLAPAGVTQTGGGNFSFDALGKPSVAQSVTISGYTTPIIVEAETGYVH